MTTPLARTVGAVATAVIAVGLWFGPTAALAAEPITDNTDVTVSVPPVTPTAKPSTPPQTTPPQTTPSNNGNGGAPTATGGAGGRGSGGGGGAGTAAPGGSPAPAPCVPKEPAVPTAPATGGGAASVDKDVYVIGETVTAVAGGFGAGEQVQLVLFSEPTLVGTFAADGTGSVTAQFAIADKTLAGSHTVQFTGWCGSTSTADVLVGSTNNASSSGPQGVPLWAWWVGGGLGLLLLLIGAWWAIRTMRVTGPVMPEVVTP